ncbi:hypothetical protein OsJ_36486 [Oryza sativa Japonica Group]|uniref:Uncharacterized protein n=1 Tax=Oryza sativa subsp. japonica TaxID=39947 RepID=B9GDQ5_ORYSJ|nr:hypothetical protein OsJ_36486 [Oryza sativa Japonica Group]
MRVAISVLGVLVIIVAHAAAHVAARDDVEVVAPGPTHLVLHLRRIPRLRASSSTAAIPGYYRVRLPPSEEDPPQPRPPPHRSRTAWHTVDEPGDSGFDGGNGDGGGCGQAVAASMTVGERGGSGFDGGKWREALRAILSF